jgi:hypothetical protein
MALPADSGTYSGNRRPTLAGFTSGGICKPENPMPAFKEHFVMVRVYAKDMVFVKCVSRLRRAAYIPSMLKELVKQSVKHVTKRSK